MYSDVIYTLIRFEISHRTRRWCLKYVMVYLARDIPAFVCNVLRQWSISLIPTYRVYQLYDTVLTYATYTAHVSRMIVWAIPFLHKLMRLLILFQNTDSANCVRFPQPQKTIVSKSSCQLKTRKCYSIERANCYTCDIYSTTSLCRLYWLYSTS